jgi:hypothetical protein
MDRVLVITLHGFPVPAFVPTGQIISHAMAVFVYDDDFHFGVLSSEIHWAWAARHSSSLGTSARYTPSDVFETFPQPEFSETVAAAGGALDRHRSSLMLANGQGLTGTYSRVHDPEDDDPGLVRLRELHADLDLAVWAAYGWSPIDFEHGFHDTSQGVRYTIGPAARIEVLDRLLDLNHARYAEEVRLGLHDKKSPTTKRKVPASAVAPGQLALAGEATAPEAE